MSHLNLNDIRSEALFASTLQPSEKPTAAQVRGEIKRTVRHLGACGCAARMAQEFGDAPSCAAARMHWARSLVDDVFTTPPARTLTAPVGQTAA
jgi:hypothetical protein